MFKAKTVPDVFQHVCSKTNLICSLGVDVCARTRSFSSGAVSAYVLEHSDSPEVFDICVQNADFLEAFGRLCSKHILSLCLLTPMCEHMRIPYAS